MPMMKSRYAHQIISLTGHSVEFEADVAIWVPESRGLVEECLERGAVLCDDAEVIGAPTQPGPVAAPEEKSDNVEDGEGTFEAALNAALLRILTRNDPSDLKSDLTPKVVKVTAEMSPDLRRPTATEVSDAYQRLQENIDLAE